MELETVVGHVEGWKGLFNKPYERGLYPDLGAMPIPEDCEYLIFYKNTYTQGKGSITEYEPIDYLPEVKFHEDRYAQPLMYADADDVYDWCRANQRHYYRIDALYRLLGVLIPGFKKESAGESLYVVLFGH